MTEVEVVEEKALTVKENDRLEELEAIISKNFLAFYKVGCALREIRESRLYRETHPTFEGYCKDVWEAGKTHTYRLIDSSQVIENLSPIGDFLPRNEAQVRPLTRLSEPEDQIAAWKRALQLAELSETKVTAFYVEQAVIELLGGRTKRKLKEIRKKLNDSELDMDFKRAISPLLTIIGEAKKAGWKTANKEYILRMIDYIREILAED